MRKADIVWKIMGTGLNELGFQYTGYDFYEGWKFSKVLENDIV